VTARAHGPLPLEVGLGRPVDVPQGA
jgi:hypothetical protein